MRALVAGGAGFLGSHLVDALLARGDVVTVVDDLSTGSLANLAHVRSRRLRVIRSDVIRTRTDRFDRIYHLASPASPEAYGRMPIRTLRTNAEGTYRLLTIATATGARFLLASTSEVYGDPLVHPQHEDYRGNVDPIGPRSQYDEGKRYAEALTVAFARERGTDVRIARIFNAYGPRMRSDDGRLPVSMVVAALAGDPMIVHGTGTQTRSLCYVTDVVRGLVTVMERGSPCTPYNVGSDKEVSVLAFAQRVRRLARSRSKIVRAVGRPDDVRRRRPHLGRIRALGWEPRRGLDSGIAETLRWYRRR